MKLNAFAPLITAIIGALQLSLALAAAQPTTDLPWQYILLKGSEIVDECPICDRVPIPVPIHGSFQLRLVQHGPLFSYYTLENIDFSGGSPFSTSFKITGQGTYQVGGQLAVMQSMFLDLRVDQDQATQQCYFETPNGLVERSWPFLQLGLTQTNGTMVQTYTLKLIAAPVRDLWFSTAHGFTPANFPDDRRGSGGDLVSYLGRIVKPNTTLLREFGIMPPTPDLGLDAAGFLPGGEMVFSTTTDAFSERLGQKLQHGDLLSSRGSIVQDNASLLAAFNLEPAVEDAGLDAVQIREDGDIYFSVNSNLFSKTLNSALGHGDLLSSQGYVVRRNADLLAKFSPPDPKHDYGLDAFYIWPGDQEIWFSVAEGFESKNPDVGTVMPGDLLSDFGTVIYRNLDLLAVFSPLEDLADFGLDALYVVTDSTPLPPSRPALQFTAFTPAQPAGTLSLEWQGAGRVFQLEKANTVLGPYQPLSPIIPDLSFDDAGALNSQPQGYYRVRQW